MMRIEQVIYSSDATRALSEVELSLLLLGARKNNASLNVSGMLLYHDGKFLQVLEGERSTVQTLYDRIAKDPRHRRVLLLLRQSTEKRQFDGWSMGFASLKGLALELPGYSDFLRHNSEPAKAGSMASKLLAQFRGEKFIQHVQR